MTTLDEKILFIWNAEFDAYAQNHVGAIVELFKVRSYDEAHKVAQAFSGRFSIHAIDREFTSIRKEFMTIVDHLEVTYSFNQETYLKLLIDAFTAYGFIRAKDGDAQMNWLYYCSELVYSRYPCDTRVSEISQSFKRANEAVDEMMNCKRVR